MSLHRLDIGKNGEDRRCQSRVDFDVREEILTPRGRFRRRRRPEHEGNTQPLDDLSKFELVPSSTPVLERARRSVDTRSSTTTEVVGLGGKPPGTGESELIAVLLEDRERI